MEQRKGDAPKAALAYGVSNLSYVKRAEDDDWYTYPPAIDFVRNEMASEGLLKLYSIVNTPATETEKFFVQHASFKRDDVVDAVGTSHLRNHDYANAIEWLGKAAKPEPLTETQYNYKTARTTTTNIDPFFDYLNDWQRFSLRKSRSFLSSEVQEQSAVCKI